MHPLTLALWGWAGMAVVMLLLYLLARVRKDAGIVDVGWSAGVGALAVWYAAWGAGDPVRRVLLAVLAGVWGLRLAGYLLVNRVLSPGEDGRYAMLREKFGRRAETFFLGFFQVQALWAVLFSVPFLPVAFHAGPFPTVWDVCGIIVWGVAVAGESLADRQLARFRDRPGSSGRTCREGLWRYSRHPNYFFEWVHLFAYVFLAMGAPWWPVAFAGPIVMLVFLYKITGIPYTEKRALASRGDEYRRYQQTTSAFVPWPPREDPY